MSCFNSHELSLLHTHTPQLRQRAEHTQAQRKQTRQHLAHEPGCGAGRLQRRSHVTRQAHGDAAAPAAAHVRFPRAQPGPRRGL